MGGLLEPRHAQGLGAALVAGAVLGGGASLIDQACPGYPISWGQVGKDTLFGAAGGALGYGAGKGIQWAARTPAGQAVTGWAGRQASRIPGVQRLAENLGAKGAGEGAQEISSVTDDALNSVATPANASPMPRAELPAAPARPQIEPPGKIGPDFIADDQGTIIPTSRTRLEEGLQSAGLDTFSTDSPGTGYVLPDGSRVRVMDATKYASQRASFTNANDGPVSPFTGKPPNPPKEISNTKKWVRERCHIDLFD